MTEKVKNSNLVPWFKQKTSWTLISGMIAAIGGYLTGEVSLIVCIGTCMGGLSGIFMRQGVEKSRNISDLPPSQRGEEVTESSG